MYIFHLTQILFNNRLLEDTALFLGIESRSGPARPGPRPAGKAVASPLAPALAQAALCLVSGTRYPLSPPIPLASPLAHEPRRSLLVGGGKAKGGISPFSEAFHRLVSRL